MNILVPNLGSTSLKYQILEMPAERVLARGRLERVRDYGQAIGEIQSGGAAIDAVAFKTVHGGPRFRGAFRADPGVLAALEEFLPAAPAHNSIYLLGIRAFQDALPGVPLVAAFETEFHATLPEHARAYGVPRAWREAGVERYGFHGASHRYVSERVAGMLGRESRLVSCHLGGSSSICAIDRGRSMDTTMGFSPQSGLESATRHGDLDVFAVLYMMKRCGWEREEIERRLTSEGGLDAVAFTGGIGENSAALRCRCSAGLEFLGIELDPARNEQGAGDRLVSSDRARVAVLALATNEELIVARRAYRLLAA